MVDDTTHYWQEVDHTADWALRVWGGDLRALYEHAALGMLELAGGEPDAAGARIVRTVTLSAPDAETLLVDWLTELLILIEDEGLVFDQVDVHRADGHSLEAAVSGRPGGGFAKHIKAVTFHNLQIACTDDGCETTIVFDV
jgi:SHS2 domain-containing protein